MDTNCSGWLTSSVRTREYLATAEIERLMAAAGCTRSPRRHDLLRLLSHPARKPHNAQDPRHHAQPRPSRRHDRRPGRL
jgi:hypothetical protein